MLALWPIGRFRIYSCGFGFLFSPTLPTPTVQVPEYGELCVCAGFECDYSPSSESENVANLSDEMESIDRRVKRFNMLHGVACFTVWAGFRSASIAGMCSGMPEIES
jgi:hypothetical protein